MKVTAVETVRIPRHRQQLWVQVHTDEGPIGLGETCIGPATVEAHIHETVAPHLLGTDPLRTGHHWRRLYDTFVGYGGTGAETRGLSAVDLALWDIRGQADGRPLYEVLGGRVRDDIRIYNTCAGYGYGRGNAGALLASDRATPGDRGLPTADRPGPYEDLEAAIRRPGDLASDLLGQGITGMKLWPFDEYAAATAGHDISPAQLREGTGKLREIRDAVGDSMDVMLELHALWDLPTARRIAEATADLGLYWIEDPLKADDLEAVARFARSSRVPVALGETLGTRWSFAQLLDRQAADVVMFDLGWVGGLSEAQRISAMAETRHLPVAPHDCTGPVVLTASTHLAVHAPNAVLQETVRAYYTGWYRDVVTELPQIADGRIAPPDTPGLGTALRPDVLDHPDTTRTVTALGDLR
ncbi:mandelate racemase/muconate lactonizing enzyme family protein [Nakamurella endophytica]|uniref:Mandelate racemase n=1 Tax=Nakamurella endophytica TaxID=1748367 RepID=A0A917T987_9ACTN|nr:mandelate racemase/muconate lactonizing enzyme family protein [Nakamurella endophytica]GGM14016.1 mandelate racemase [Nakamurella endophytica]